MPEFDLNLSTRKTFSDGIGFRDIHSLKAFQLTQKTNGAMLLDKIFYQGKADNIKYKIGESLIFFCRKTPQSSGITKTDLVRKVKRVSCLACKFVSLL